eukprot:2262244-Pleurochrysis_carterae.AAC.1
MAQAFALSSVLEERNKRGSVRPWRKTRSFDCWKGAGRGARLVAWRHALGAAGERLELGGLDVGVDKGTAQHVARKEPRLVRRYAELVDLVAGGRRVAGHRLNKRAAIGEAKHTLRADEARKTRGEARERRSSERRSGGVGAAKFALRRPQKPENATRHAWEHGMFGSRDRVACARDDSSWDETTLHIRRQRSSTTASRSTEHKKHHNKVALSLSRLRPGSRRRARLNDALAKSLCADQLGAAVVVQRRGEHLRRARRRGVNPHLRQNPRSSSTQTPERARRAQSE